MKLNEILRVANRVVIETNKLNLEQGKIAGQIEGKPVWKIPSINPNEYAFCFKNENGQIISHIYGGMLNYKGNNYFVLVDTFTDKNYQKQGLATALYMFVITKMNIKILSDDQQTPQGENLWKSIKKQHADRVKILDVSTGKIHNSDEVSPNDVYIDGSDASDKSRRYRLVLEKYECPMGIPEFGKGILRERIIYTHPDNYGQFI